LGPAPLICPAACSGCWRRADGPTPNMIVYRADDLLEAADNPGLVIPQVQTPTVACALNGGAPIESMDIPTLHGHRRTCSDSAHTQLSVRVQSTLPPAPAEPAPPGGRRAEDGEEEEEEDPYPRRVCTRVVPPRGSNRKPHESCVTVQGPPPPPIPPSPPLPPPGPPRPVMDEIMSATGVFREQVRALLHIAAIHSLSRVSDF